MLALFPARASSQTSPTADRTDALRVFLDCNSCDENYLRTEITFINYVRDRTDADLHVLVTTQGTGGGGTEYTMKFIGLGKFAGVDQSLKYLRGPDEYPTMKDALGLRRSSASASCATLPRPRSPRA